jgi:twitching motility protein PilT
MLDLRFSDAYLGNNGFWLSGVPGEADPIRAPDGMEELFRCLRGQCSDIHKETRKREFGLWDNTDGVKRGFRVSVLTSMQDTIFVLRPFPNEVPHLDSLGLHKTLMEKLLAPDMTGLLPIVGAFGQGKTTTASALLTARLRRHGGVAVTIEDPPELPLEGPHGSGVCYQTWAAQGEFAQECRHAARWGPHIIFLGEVRDPETATEALRASLNGRLILCTLHSDNAIGAIERLAALATGTAGTREDVNSMLSQGLAAIIHQKLIPGPKNRKVPVVESLFFTDNIGARNIVRSGNFAHLGSEISLQANRLAMSSGRTPA